MNVYKSLKTCKKVQVIKGVECSANTRLHKTKKFAVLSSTLFII